MGAAAREAAKFRGLFLRWERDALAGGRAVDVCDRGVEFGAGWLGRGRLHDGHFRFQLRYFGGNPANRFFSHLFPAILPSKQNLYFAGVLGRALRCAQPDVSFRAYRDRVYVRGSRSDPVCGRTDDAHGFPPDRSFHFGFRTRGAWRILHAGRRALGGDEGGVDSGLRADGRIGHLDCHGIWQGGRLGCRDECRAARALEPDPASERPVRPLADFVHQLATARVLFLGSQPDDGAAHVECAGQQSRTMGQPSRRSA